MTRYPSLDGTQNCHAAPLAMVAAFNGSRGADSKPAGALCYGCPFLWPCRAWALEHDIHGVWGLTEEKRDRGRRADGAAPVPVSDELDELVGIWRTSESSVSR
jgi:hypothetical protein